MTPWTHGDPEDPGKLQRRQKKCECPGGEVSFLWLVIDIDMLIETGCFNVADVTGC